jgi:putative PIN family toxin of toxin-antitoxin system
MKFIFDTNVVIDGFHDDFSAAAQLIDYVNQGKAQLILTSAIQGEYQAIMQRLITSPEYWQRINHFLQQATMVRPVPSVNVTIDDPEDYKFLQAAAGSRADYIITSDQHLLSLGQYRHTSIVTPQQCWQRLQDESNPSSDWKNMLRSWGLSA